jgi:hypothetical protein
MDEFACAASVITKPLRTAAVIKALRIEPTPLQVAAPAA